jgi:hypothetical protein
MAHDVFISYSSKDGIIADAVCARLEERGIRCWIAPRDVNAGSPYAEEITVAIEACTAMVLVFSSNANVSTHIPKEIERAVSRSIPVIPLRIEAVVPSKSLDYFISSVHWLDAITPPLERHLENLANTIVKILERPRPASTPAGGLRPLAAPSLFLPDARVKRNRTFGFVACIGAAAVALAVGSWLLWSHPADGTPDPSTAATPRSDTLAASSTASKSTADTPQLAAEAATGQTRQARVEVTGRWVHQESPQSVFILKQDGDAVTSEGSFGHADGHFLGPDTIALSWQSIGVFQGTVKDDMIHWTNGNTWRRTATGQAPQARVDVSGRWILQQSPQYSLTLEQNGDAVTSEGGPGHAEGIFIGPDTLVLSWQSIGTFQGTVKDNMIYWSNGVSWKREGR